MPPELLEYVENGRNPDIYTREFVELVRRGNQLMRGKTGAFGAFRDVLAADVAAALPELRDDVRRVCEATGGRVPPGLEEGGSDTRGGSMEAGGAAAEAGAAAAAATAAEHGTQQNGSGA